MLKLGAGICGKAGVSFVGFGVIEMLGVMVSCPLPTLITVDAPDFNKLDDGTGVIVAEIDVLTFGFDGDVDSDGCGLLVVGNIDIADDFGTDGAFSALGAFICGCNREAKDEVCGCNIVAK